RSPAESASGSCHLGRSQHVLDWTPRQHRPQQVRPPLVSQDRDSTQGATEAASSPSQQRVQNRIERLQVQFLKSLAHLQSCQALQEQHRRRREEEALALEDKDQTPAEPKGKPGFMSYFSVARQECKVQDGKNLEDRREEAEDDTIFLEDALCFLEQQSENMFKREEWLSRRQETCQPRFLASALHVPLSCLSVQRLWCSTGPLGSALIPSRGASSSQPQPFVLQKKCAGACTAAQSVPTPMSCAVGARVSFCLVCDQYMPAGLEALMP
ncbi:unnamed protein product, partial [Polarella glacialis]